MINIKPVIQLLVCCCVITGFTARADNNAFSQSLPLQCFVIPQSQSALCSASTNNFNDQSKDMTLYLMDEYQQFRLLDTQKADGELLWLWGLSAGGKYTVLVSSEEGHSSYALYLTKDITKGGNAEFPKPVALVSDYFLSELIYLNDDGKAIFARLGGISNANPGICRTQLSEPIADKDPHACYVDVSIDQWLYQP